MRIFGYKKGLLMLICFGLLYQPATVNSEEIKAAVAANFRLPFDKIVARFEKTSNHRIKTIVDSSGALTTKIINGAPFDLFLSANMAYPEKLYQDGLAQEKPKIYGIGSLVIWSFKTDLSLTESLIFLKDASVKKIGIANPKHAPYGKAAVEALQSAGIYPDVEKKIVFGESISQVDQFVVTQSVEVGFVAESSAIQYSDNNQNNYIQVPPRLYNPILQGMVILTDKTLPRYSAVKSFYDFILSEETEPILKQFGYRKDESGIS